MGVAWWVWLGGCGLDDCGLVGVAWWVWLGGCGLVGVAWMTVAWWVWLGGCGLVGVALWVWRSSRSLWLQSATTQ